MVWRRRAYARGDTVALCLTADADLPVALLGVLKAGAAYVPVDPATPTDRIAELCAEAGVRLVVGSSEVASLMSMGEVKAGPPITPDDLAYVLFTSGSTGRPKGVAVTHRNLTAYLGWYATHYELTGADRALGHLNFGFDLSVPELYAPLISGGALVLADPQRRTDPRHLTGLAQSAGVTLMAATPTVLRLLAEDGGLAGCEALRLIVSCGEPLPADLIAVLADQTHAQLDNQYGPTETTVAVTCWPTNSRAGQTSTIAPLGQPIGGCRIYLNDAYGQPVPPGSLGELQVGGDQVARGYLGSPGLTADRFRPDPQAAVPGARLYRTGDLARLCADGELEYAGRADRQVKVRGIRVEPGEVEGVLTGHPLVRHAAVVADGGRLDAFVVPATDDLCTVGAAFQDELRSFLMRRLPSHLVPATLSPLDALPTTANGKVDYHALARQAVPPPAAARDQPPSTPTETEIAAIYAELLGRARVGVADDFFALGGQSLLAVRAVTQIRQRLGVDLPLRTLFAAPIVAELAREVDDLLLAGVDAQTLAALLDQVPDARSGHVEEAQ